MIRAVWLAVVATMVAASAGDAADLGRAAVDFKTPAEIRWVRNAAGTNESATATPAEKR